MWSVYCKDIVVVWFGIEVSEEVGVVVVCVVISNGNVLFVDDYFVGCFSEWIVDDCVVVVEVLVEWWGWFWYEKNGVEVFGGWFESVVVVLW